MISWSYGPQRHPCCWWYPLSRPTRSAVHGAPIYTLHVLRTISSPSTLCGARCTACCPWYVHAAALCTHYHQHVLTTIPSPSTLCGVRGGDVLCMLTHCPCCAAHITTYACTCNIMLQRPSPMVGAVVLLCDTTSTHSCCTYTPHALCVHITTNMCSPRYHLQQPL